MTKPKFIPEYTVADYRLWDGDWELWNGIPVAMSPSPNFRHQRVSLKIAATLDNQLVVKPCAGGCVAVYEIDWQVDQTTVVRPDVMVLCEEPVGDFVESPPTLIAEILSPSTRKKDLTAKRELYATEGVKYYLIFDPDDNSAQFFQVEEETYRLIPNSIELRLDDDCVVYLKVDDIFG